MCDSGAFGDDDAQAKAASSYGDEFRALRQERDRLLRALTFYRTSDMIGGSGDELDDAARIARLRRDEIDLLRADLTRTARALGAQAEDAETARTTSAKHLRQLRAELEALAREKEGVRSELQRANSEGKGWEHRAHSLEDEIDMMYERCGRLEDSLRVAGIDLQLAAARVVDLEASTCWRLTAPLRLISDRLSH